MKVIGLSHVVWRAIAPTKFGKTFAPVEYVSADGATSLRGMQMFPPDPIGRGVVMFGSVKL